MQKTQQTLRVAWALLLGLALTGFIQAPEAVGWLLASLSALTPLCISLALNGPEWDRTFFSIAVYSLSIVAVAVCLGQWAVLDASPVILALMPVASLILWIVHERIYKRQGQ